MRKVSYEVTYTMWDGRRECVVFDTWHDARSFERECGKRVRSCDIDTRIDVIQDVFTPADLYV